MRTKFLVLAAITILTMGSAQANYSREELQDSAGEYTKFEVSPYNKNGYFGYYNKFFSFSLDRASNLELTATVLNAGGGDFLENNLVLYTENTGEEFWGMSFSTGTNSAHFDNLAVGKYAYGVAGYNGGTDISYVSFSSTFTNAVPEPETYALMLGGLGVIGFIARRRKTL